MNLQIVNMVATVKLSSPPDLEKLAAALRDAHKWEVGPERTAASEFDAGYYGGLLEKAWTEAAFVFAHMTANDQPV